MRRERVLLAAMAAAAGISVLLPAAILVYTAVGAVVLPAGNSSLFPMIMVSLLVIFLTLLLAFPMGIATAVYLAEYRRESRLRRQVRILVDTLTGIPSILYGLVGLLVFSRMLGWGQSLLAGGATMALMILPVIIRETEDTLADLPRGMRSGAFALGANRLQVLWYVVLPQAVPGMLAAGLRAVARVAGETAPVLLTVGAAQNLPRGILDSGRTLSVHLYYSAQEAAGPAEAGGAFMTALLLAGFAAVAHVGARLVRQLETRKRKEMVHE